MLDLKANFHSGGSEWKDPKLEALLQQRMPKAYSSYMDTMESMLETIKGLEESLGTDKTHFQSHVSIKGECVRQLYRSPQCYVCFENLVKRVITDEI